MLQKLKSKSKSSNKWRNMIFVTTDYQHLFRKFWTDMLWSRQPTRANRQIATISTSDPVDPPLPATASVGISVPQNCDNSDRGHTPCSTAENIEYFLDNGLKPKFWAAPTATTEKVPVGDTTCSTTDKVLTWCLFLLRCRRRRNVTCFFLPCILFVRDLAVLDAGAHLRVRTSTAVAPFCEKWLVPRLWTTCGHARRRIVGLLVYRFVLVISFYFERPSTQI